MTKVTVTREASDFLIVDENHGGYKAGHCAICGATGWMDQIKHVRTCEVGKALNTVAKEPTEGNLPLLQSGFAILDIKRGRKKLAKLLAKDGSVDVVIYGTIRMAWGDDDGESQEFEVDVRKSVLYGPPPPKKKAEKTGWGHGPCAGDMFS